MTTIPHRLDALGLEAKKTRFCGSIGRGMEEVSEGLTDYSIAQYTFWRIYARPAISELLTELEMQAKMLRLAILNGEHPAGMDADYLAELRDRATAKTEEGSDE